MTILVVLSVVILALIGAVLFYMNKAKQKEAEIAEVVDSSLHHGGDQVFFGATVTYADDDGKETTVTILGVDEAESARHEISWVSPVARALLKARVGDLVRLVVPGGSQELEVLAVSYPPPAT